MSSALPNRIVSVLTDEEIKDFKKETKELLAKEIREGTQFRFALSDQGNGERLAHRYRGAFVFTKAKAWLVYANGKFAEDMVAEVDKAAVITVRLIIEEAAGLDDKAAEAYIGWAKRSESQGKIEAMKARAAANAAFVRNYNDFGRGKALFTLGNKHLLFKRRK